MQPQGRILEIVGASLGEEQMAGVIVYLDPSEIQSGQKVQVGDVQFEVPWNAQVVFVDLEPRANWGHACCYLAIALDTNEVIQVAAHMPPFLKAGTSTYRLLWRGPLAPEWAVVIQAPPPG